MSNKKETVKKEGKKDTPKQSLIARTRKNLRVSFAELKKVHWPTLNENLTYTGVVMVTVAIMAVLIWVADSGITALFGLFI